MVYLKTRPSTARIGCVVCVKYAIDGRLSIDGTFYILQKYSGKALPPPHIVGLFLGTTVMSHLFVHRVVCAFIFIFFSCQILAGGYRASRVRVTTFQKILDAPLSYAPCISMKTSKHRTPPERGCSLWRTVFLQRKVNPYDTWYIHYCRKCPTLIASNVRTKTSVLLWRG